MCQNFNLWWGVPVVSLKNLGYRYCYKKSQDWLKIECGEGEREWERVIMIIFSLMRYVKSIYTTTYNYMKWGTIIKQKIEKVTDVTRWHNTATVTFSYRLGL